MIRKIACVCLLALALVPAAAADWKTEILAFLGPRPDCRKALALLAERLGGMEAGDRQIADALLPYLHQKLGEAAAEREGISDYYEKYHDGDPEFVFLDDFTRRDFLMFWLRWKSAYPLVSDMNFLLRNANTGANPPAAIEVGLDLLNDAFYRISLGPHTLEGGFWPRGFHILTLSVADMFSRPGSYEFTLDLKSGDFVVRKPIRIDVEISTIASPAAPAPVMPEVRDGSKSRKTPVPSATNIGGDLSLWVGGRLIMTTRKLAVRVPAINIPIPGPSMAGTKPYMPPPTTDPFANAIPILDALAFGYKTVKDLLAKKPVVPSAPTYQKVESLTFTYGRTAEDGAATKARAVFRLGRIRAAPLRP
jgi:hypothetical protein